VNRRARGGGNSNCRWAGILIVADQSTAGRPSRSPGRSSGATLTGVGFSGAHGATPFPGSSFSDRAEPEGHGVTSVASRTSSGQPEKPTPVSPWPSLCKGGKRIGRSRRRSIARNKNTRLETVPPVRSTPTFHRPTAVLAAYLLHLGPRHTLGIVRGQDDDLFSRGGRQEHAV
jgi:hypothetical protein